MAELDEILRLNPVAAAGLEGIREVLEDVKRLREAGIATGPKLPDPRGPRTLGELKALKASRSLFQKNLST